MSDDELSLLPKRLGLPRGRAALPENEVEDSQRGRIMQAVTDEAAELGYAHMTVGGITRRAHVSRTTFYQCFADKEESFAAAHLSISDQLIALVRERAAATADTAWRERIELGVQATIDSLEAWPSYARSFVVEVHRANDEILRQRDWVVEEVRIPTDLEVIGAIGATEELLSREIRRSAPGESACLARVKDPVVAVHTAILRPE